MELSTEWLQGLHPSKGKDGGAAPSHWQRQLEEKEKANCGVDHGTLCGFSGWWLLLLLFLLCKGNMGEVALGQWWWQEKEEADHEREGVISH